jgi:uncharacterized membrane-anchored protein
LTERTEVSTKVAVVAVAPVVVMVMVILMIVIKMIITMTNESRSFCHTASRGVVAVVRAPAASDETRAFHDV